MNDEAERIRELERSNDELRGALIAAGRELRKVAQTKRRKVLLELLRRTLADARNVKKSRAAYAGETTAVYPDPRL